jgi:hypothetical protein
MHGYETRQEDPQIAAMEASRRLSPIVFLPVALCLGVGLMLALIVALASA